MKKDKVIKSTLELILASQSTKLQNLNEVDAQDWFTTSGVVSTAKESEVLGKFDVEGENFTIIKATAHKCPRCWKFQAASEEGLCPRCAEVLDA